VNNKLSKPRRRRRSTAEIAQVLKEYQTSGLTLREYAQQQDLGYSTLAQWVQRARQLPSPRPVPAPVTFLPVQTIPALGAAPYQLRWPGGFALLLEPGFDPAQVRHLLTLLPPCSP